MVETTCEGFQFFTQPTYEVFCGNQFTTKIAENSIKHDRSKHVYIDRNFIYEKFEDNTIEVPYVKTLEQLGDVLTKVAFGKAFNNSLFKMDIHDVYDPSLGEVLA